MLSPGIIPGLFTKMNKYYAVLGLPSTASKDEVRKKYRQLVLTWHPDRNPSEEAPAKFIAITEAYDILMGERKVPRVFQTYTRRSAPAPPRKKTTHEIYLERFNRDRQAIKAAGREDLLKRIAHGQIQTARVVCVVSSVIGLAVWFLPLDLVSSFVLSLFLLRYAFGAGVVAYHRKKQAEMKFGDSNYYTVTDLRDVYFARHTLNVFSIMQNRGTLRE